MATPLTVEDWPPAPVRTARLVLRAPQARDRATFVDLGSDAEVDRHLGGPRERDVLEAELPEVPADRPAQFVVEHDGVLVGWIGLSRLEPDRPGRLRAVDDTDVAPLELSCVTPVRA
ncbi:GNAT family N-acetyltransferase [Nocardioides hwasunensis]|uniref:GNAT family N-acetyltransferase n=1 Tax=Nocardioides hwasunensis TaxID=397258 RepID=A0ABR8ML88_9ACTN|nr:GNAT family N-acetyltransferase [Nocardioides hwasunensis]MBD3915831.1 GNAT family N-acetyltransferase [Nocardioides hwasunensis]